ncbi:alanine racemase [Sulfurimonas sp. SWIR-19]|uniref:alanine racemase n=1 Tax=Sulfurimonas sp. SWIR-19 TaxID=2878390 RepID=UPI001CF56503|nr:alanine racemase [Sulfurimonas sp. SWIR-19]UCN00678.1 alanine racemase [Sulfurimonas sp. SWIR-19]
MAYITLDKNHFFHNLDIITKLTKTKDKTALVLKDNAYGHGLLQIAQMAKEYGITKAVVRTDEEAKQIEDFFEYILVLADFAQESNEKIRYTINDLQAINKFAKNTKVELKVDTGMCRNGIVMSELEEAFVLCAKQGLRLEAVFTHHSSADEENEYFDLQNKNFQQVKKEARALAKKYAFDSLRFHSCNSAALFRTNDFDEDMARVGIAAYGCLELPNALHVKGLHVKKLAPVLSVYAKKISSRRLQKGDCVGYGAAYETEFTCKVSNYDFGYGDGFLRSCSHTYVTPEGIKIAGRISMDNASFLTCKEEILIFNDAREAARYAGTISYEMLTSLKGYLVRKVVS